MVSFCALWWSAINHTADLNVQEKSDRALVPLNRSNKEGQPSAEVGYLV
jgi:hypothetical protein